MQPYDMDPQKGRILTHNGVKLFLTVHFHEISFINLSSTVNFQFNTVIQNPRSRSLIQKWSGYKKYFFYAFGSSLHHIF